jgi:8-oxo-dGTP pyrophosphatase MutT (NUDIX family)
MVREISAGGVVVRRSGGAWEMAAIQPQREVSETKKSSKMLLALPKGLIDPGEKPEHAAIREVREETGLTVTPITKLRDIKYVYVRTWGDQERVFKIVGFYLMRYESGTIDKIDSAMRVEVKQALWIPLQDAALKLTYGGEREVAKAAVEYLKSHSEA